MASTLLQSLRDRKVDNRLLEGEWVIDVVVKHWIVYLKAWGIFFGALMLWVLAALSHRQVVTVPLLLIGAGLAGYAVFGIMAQYRDVFVITNMRVFRVTGVFNRTTATMPINRILDFTVHQPFIGRVLGARNPRHGFGHLTFETAAQDQGLRDIRDICDPAGRDLTIQQVVQDAGLRGNVSGSGL